MNKNLLYRNIPKVDILLENIKIQELIETYGRETVVETIREALESLRAYIKECDAEENALERINSLVSDIEKKVISINTPDIRSVINGTGTILHTNLGRAPISPRLQQDIPIWNIIWRRGNVENVTHILKNCCVRLPVQRLRWR